MLRTIVALLAGASGVACDDPGPAHILKARANVDGPGEELRVAYLFFTSDLLGEVEPCGCRTRPLGGIQRIAAIVDARAPRGSTLGTIFCRRRSPSTKPPSTNAKRATSRASSGWQVGLR
ncbi:MAG: hypothetical protein HC923_07090 [Myxococcales bacterium]|nr:hypothetical protein [Myxococcales bacterium]